jgi:hypothetical protein
MVLVSEVWAILWLIKSLFAQTYNFSKSTQTYNVSPINRNNQGFANLGRLTTFATFNANTLLPQILAQKCRILTVCKKQKIKPLLASAKTKASA